eukprot:5169037-Amphidinium_carterae.1
MKQACGTELLSVGGTSLLVLRQNWQLQQALAADDACGRERASNDWRMLAIGIHIVLAYVPI